MARFFYITIFPEYRKHRIEKGISTMRQRPLLGFFLALIAAMTWGTLPIAAQQVLKVMDAQTLV